jgi:hypothetical protein
MKLDVDCYSWFLDRLPLPASVKTQKIISLDIELNMPFKTGRQEMSLICELCKLFVQLCNTFVFKDALFYKAKANVVSDYNSNLSETGQSNIKPDHFRDTASFKN